MAEYPIHPYIIHCLELLLANAAARVVLALDGRWRQRQDHDGHRIGRAVSG